MKEKTPVQLRILWTFDGKDYWVMSILPNLVVTSARPTQMPKQQSLERLARVIADEAGLEAEHCDISIEEAPLEETPSSIINERIKNAKECGYITISPAKLVSGSQGKS